MFAENFGLALVTANNDLAEFCVFSKKQGNVCEFG